MDVTYENLFTAVSLVNSSDRTAVDLRQYPDGPTLNVICQAFLATHRTQTLVLQQGPFGWHSAETTAYFLATTKIDISSYVQSCVPFALREACALSHPCVFFFKLTWCYKDVSKLLIHKFQADLSRIQLFDTLWRCIQPCVS